MIYFYYSQYVLFGVAFWRDNSTCNNNKKKKLNIILHTYIYRICYTHTNIKILGCLKSHCVIFGDFEDCLFYTKN